MLDPSTITEQVSCICRSYGVRTLDLFGSAAGDGFAPDSDVDLLVAFHGKDDLFNRYMGLLEDLREILARDVDLVMSESIRNPIFRDEVMAHRVPVYAA